MTRCIEFMQRCEREGPDWCKKCPESVRLIENYLDLCNNLETHGVPKETTFVGLSEGASRPVFAIRDAGIQERVISHIENALKRETPQGGRYHKRITVSQVEKIIRARKMAFADFVGSAGAHQESLHREIGKGEVR